MKASVILAHPFGLSFNHAIFGAAIASFTAAGVETFGHDLYQEGFDPVMTVGELGKEESTDPLVRRYAAELLESSCLVFIHPNWWGQPPAIMKGYIDRVIRPPYAYDVETDGTGSSIVEGRLSGRIGVVFNTSNTAAVREEEYFHDPLESIWKRCVFGFCGIEDCRRRMFRVVETSDETQRRLWLEEVRDIIGEVARGMRS
jgi:putative NADPH-quinone reductase